MALEATFRELTTCLRNLYEFVNQLHISMDFKPEEEGAAVAYDLLDITSKMMGHIHDAQRGALKAREALRHPTDLDQARRALTICQEKFHLLEEEYAANLVAYKRLRELDRVSGRSSKWAQWAGSTKQDIEHCRALLEQTSKALATCWHELVEHGGKTSIAVTNTGQRIIARSPLADDRVRQRMT
jgi:hypothetical protein